MTASGSFRLFLPRYSGVAVDVEFLLTWLPCLDLRREEPVELLDGVGIVTWCIGVIGAVYPLSAVESAFTELLDEQGSRENISLETDIEFLAALVAAGDVVVGIAEVIKTS